jgi:hypothetical protein
MARLHFKRPFTAGTIFGMSPLSSLGRVDRVFRGPVRSCLATLPQRGGTVLCASGLALPRPAVPPGASLPLGT